MHEVPRQDHVFAERTVDGWGGEEGDIRAQVVTPGAALLAAPARHAGLHRDGGAYFEIGDVGSETCDNTGGFVAEDEGLLDDEVRDAAVLEVVDVAAADTDGFHLHENFIRSGFGDLALLDAKTEIRVQNTDTLFHG